VLAEIPELRREGVGVACFTDQEHDGESGLQYFGARYYDPWIGRFLERDPELISAQTGISFAGITDNPQQFNAYSYALNAPTVFADPTGGFATRESAPVGGVSTGMPASVTILGRGPSTAVLQLAAGPALPLIYVIPVVTPPLVYWWVTVGAPTVNQFLDETLPGNLQILQQEGTDSIDSVDDLVKEAGSVDGCRKARDSGEDRAGSPSSLVTIFPVPDLFGRIPTHS
jgi:RHS repeat-associated protein